MLIDSFMQQHQQLLQFFGQVDVALELGEEAGVRSLASGSRWATWRMMTPRTAYLTIV